MDMHMPERSATTTMTTAAVPGSRLQGLRAPAIEVRIKPTFYLVIFIGMLPVLYVFEKVNNTLKFKLQSMYTGTLY